MMDDRGTEQAAKRNEIHKIFAAHPTKRRSMKLSLSARLGADFDHGARANNYCCFNDVSTRTWHRKHLDRSDEMDCVIRVCVIWASPTEGTRTTKIVFYKHTHSIL